jgi:hypothetical protein
MVSGLLRGGRGLMCPLCSASEDSAMNAPAVEALDPATAQGLIARASDRGRASATRAYLMDTIG